MVLINFIKHIQKNPQLPNMEFGRRLAVEKEIEKASALSLANACEPILLLVHSYGPIINCYTVFDDSGHFLFYATMMGVKGELAVEYQCRDGL